MPRSAQLALSSLLLAIAAHLEPLAAQTTSADSARADSVRAARVQRLAPQHVTGTRLAGEASDERSAQRIERLRPRVADAGVSAAARLVEEIPGVSVSDDQGTRAQPSVDLRGFTLSPVAGAPQGVSVFLDGVRVNEPDAQQVYFDLLPIEAVSRAELVTGPAAIFGKNTLAGALLLETPRGGDVTPRAAAEIGPYGERDGHLLTGWQRGGWDGLVLARATTERGWRDESPARTRLIYATLGRGDSAGAVVLSALVARDRIYQAGSLPESWARADPRLNYTGGDFTAPSLTHLALRGSHTGAWGELRGNLYLRHTSTEQFNVNVDEADTRAFVRSTTSGGAVEWSRAMSISSRPLTVTTGGELSWSPVGYLVYAEPSAQAPDVPADCDVATGRRALCENARVRQRDGALYGQAQLALAPRVMLDAAARGDYVRLPIRDLRDPSNDGTSEYRRILPRVGITVRPRDAVRVYLSFGTGFRAPAALELACASEDAPCALPFSLGDDPPLAPVRVRNVEAGGDWTPIRALALSASVYRATVHDEIIFVASQRTAGYFQNLPRTRRQGVELSARMALDPLVRGLRVTADYGYVDATYQSEARLASALPDAPPAEPGDRMPLIPSQRGRVTLALTRLVGAGGALIVGGELGLRMVSSQYLRGDEANATPPLPGYSVGDLRLSAAHGDYAATLAVTNLLDRRYLGFGSYAENPRGALGSGAGAGEVERFVTPGYPRALRLTLRSAW